MTAPRDTTAHLAQAPCGNTAQPGHSETAPDLPRCQTARSVQEVTTVALPH
ncbi:hypothetical protein DPMN_115098 [Dreissena polymorpha]|uniref:Uncharacterized protein n=1 Tax=Dreissena polymorpha TaxID=45954 RepID=A0A9D4KKK4_DREPO|nr:hypothetical protein DPMN_115098 [Dreissena polymorpha]